MSLKIGDIAPKQEPVFVDCQSVEIGSLINSNMDLIAVAKLKGDYGDFIILKVKKEDKTMTFPTSSKVILQRVSTILKYFKKELNEDENTFEFPKPVLAKLVTGKTDKGTYYDLVDAEE